jgi:hypothetical protein
VAFISETESSAQRSTQQLLWLSGFHSHVVPVSGMSGGLWLLWLDEIHLTVLESNKHYIFAEVELVGGQR